MDLTIHNAVLDSTLSPIQVGIQKGFIETVTSAELDPGIQSIDAQGALLSPAFIEPHFHLDNALVNPVPNLSGSLKEAIEIYAKIKPNITPEDIVNRSKRVLVMSLLKGVLWFRSHVDVDQVCGLRLVEGVLQAKDCFDSIMQVDVVAFPQLGLTHNPESVDLMWQALEMGANIVGGIPHAEKDMQAAERHIEIAFEMALKHNLDIDMHVDETDNPYWHTLELLAEKTIETGWQGRVVAGHCTSMSAWDNALASRVIDKVKQANITVITNAPVNLMLHGREDSHPKRRGITRVKELIEAGVNVCCGQDDLLNMFYPFGNMDPLEVALMVAHAAHLSSPHEIQTAFDMPRYHAAKALHLEKYGIYPGAKANLVLLDASSPVDALARHGDRKYVIRDGNVLATTDTTTKQFFHV